MKFKHLAALICMLAPLCAGAAEKLTVEQIRALMAATDDAARKRDTAGIGLYLGSSFAKTVDVTDDHWAYTFNIDKNAYLGMIEEGWKSLDEYRYAREDTSILVAPDGQSAESRSTITEHLLAGGRHQISRTREYAQYGLEQGKPVITGIESFDLAPTPASDAASDI